MTLEALLMVAIFVLLVLLLLRGLSMLKQMRADHAEETTKQPPSGPPLPDP